MRDLILRVLRNRWFWRVFAGLAAVAVLWPTIWALSHHYFPTSYLIIDDGAEYVSYTQYGFFEFFFFDHRPLTAFFMGLGFAMFGHNVTALLVYASLFFALTIVAVFVLIREVSGSYIFALAFSAMALFSRLNWYFYANYFGVMESLALGMAALALFFLVRFIRNREHPVWFILFVAFVLLASWAHERYFLLFLVSIIAALVGFAGWKRKLVFTGVALGALAVFFIDRFLIARGSFLSATGTAIVWDIPAMFRNFFKLIVNTFTLADDVWYLSGITNQMLDGWHQFLFTATGILLLAIVIVGLVFFVLDLVKKRYLNAFVFLSVLAFYLFTAAAGSVSVSRVEPRWMFTCQVFLFALCSHSMTDCFSFFEDRKQRPASPFYRRPATYISLGLSALLAVGVIGTGFYALNNKEHYYIDDGADQALYYQHAILDFSREVGATDLLVAADEPSRITLAGLIPQWDLEHWNLININELDQYPYGDTGTALFLVRGGAVTYVQNASRKIILTEWTLGFYEKTVYGDVDTINLKIEDVRFPNRPANGVTTIINGETVLDHYSISGGFDYDLPIAKGKLNTIELIPDFTYNHAKEGTGEDIRDLGLYIISFGG